MVTKVILCLLESYLFLYKKLVLYSCYQMLLGDFKLSCCYLISWFAPTAVNFLKLFIAALNGPYILLNATMYAINCFIIACHHLLSILFSLFVTYIFHLLCNKCLTYKKDDNIIMFRVYIKYKIKYNLSIIQA